MTDYSRHHQLIAFTMTALDAVKPANETAGNERY
jgi:hypothetical protein